MSSVVLVGLILAGCQANPGTISSKNMSVAPRIILQSQEPENFFSWSNDSAAEPLSPEGYDVTISISDPVSADVVASGTYFHSSDLNRDGYLDLITVGRDQNINIGLAEADGKFDFTKAKILGNRYVCSAPKIKTADMDRDGYPEIIAYCQGDTNRGEGKGTVGGEPRYLVNKEGEVFESTDALTSAYEFVQKIGTEEQYNSRFVGYEQILKGVSAKGVALADIDMDGDFDLFVESDGSHSIFQHFLINEGNHRFSVQQKDRFPLRSSNLQTSTVGRTEYRLRYLAWEFVDVNDDGYPDLVGGQLRDYTHTPPEDAFKREGSSVVLFNDGKGYFSRITFLPQTEYNSSFTQVNSITSCDINSDGYSDLILAHTKRNGPNGEKPFKGFYIQTLLKDSNGLFLDVSKSTRINSKEINDSDLSNYPHQMFCADLNDDGKKDLFFATWAEKFYSGHVVGYTQASQGQFQPIDHLLFNQYAPMIASDGGFRYLGSMDDAAASFVSIEWNSEGGGSPIRFSVNPRRRE